ncbi:MAG: dihydropteroate synthase [Cyanobacteriota bacterium]|nr:dihydropteroate synthase [Cyanobacteriota bacterium]
MGVLNLTPDSFSDGGRLETTRAVVRAAERMLAQGADLLDLGAQSTRPGAVMVGPDEELRRLLPALRALQPLRRQHPGVPISIDTFEAAVAEAALAEGADWINDVRGGSGRRDAGMAALVAQRGCPYVLMHSRGDSRTMDELAVYVDVVAEVRAELQSATESLLTAGVQPEQIIWDPGLGFAKTTAQNLELLRRLDELMAAGYPLLLGPSRKRFIGAVLAEPRPRARLWGTAAVCAVAAARGAAVLRVHDVGPIAQVVRMATALTAAAPPLEAERGAAC